MTSTLELVNQVRSNLLGARLSNLNVLETTISSSPNDSLYGYNVALAYPIEGLAAGTIVSVGTHVYQTVSVDTTAQTFVGILIDKFSGASAPDAGTLVRINPDYTDLDIMRALNNAITDMSSPVNGLFNFTETVFPFDPAIQSYELDTANLGIQEVLEVSYDEPGPERIWRILPRNSYTVKREASLTDFPSGVALTLSRGGYPGFDVRVVFSVPLTQIAVWSDSQTLDLDPTIEDIPVMGSAAALLGPQEAKRNTTGAQSDTRRAAEVPAGANIGAARWFEAQYRSRIAAESARNSRLWPHRRRTH